jgi:hypothetical protein
MKYPRSANNSGWVVHLVPRAGLLALHRPACHADDADDADATDAGRGKVSASGLGVNDDWLPAETARCLQWMTSEFHGILQSDCLRFCAHFNYKKLPFSQFMVVLNTQV